MHSDIRLKYIISGNIEYYTDLWSTIFFWGSFPVFIISEPTAKSMMLATFALLAVRLANNKIGLGNWLG